MSSFEHVSCKSAFSEKRRLEKRKKETTLVREEGRHVVDKQPQGSEGDIQKEVRKPTGGGVFLFLPPAPKYLTAAS